MKKFIFTLYILTVSLFGIGQNTLNTFSFPDISFRENSFEISAADQKQLDTLAMVLNHHNSMQIAIVGHSGDALKDSSDSHRAWLSTKRASAVRSYLLRKGIVGSRLGVYGYVDHMNLDARWVDFRITRISYLPRKKKPLPNMLPVYFEFHRWDMHPVYNDRLDSLVVMLEEEPQLRVTIRGHGDFRFKTNYEMWLSIQRANAVRDTLIKKGVDESQIKVEGSGDKRPVSGISSKNRRVEFLFTSS